MEEKSSSDDVVEVISIPVVARDSGISARLFRLVPKPDNGQFEIQCEGGRKMTERMGKFFNISITVKNTEGEQKNVNTALLGLNKSRTMFLFKYEVRPGINTVEVTLKEKHVVDSPYIVTLPNVEGRKESKPEQIKKLESRVEKKYSEKEKVVTLDIDKNWNLVPIKPGSSLSAPDVMKQTNRVSKVKPGVQVDLSAEGVWRKKLSIMAVNAGGRIDGPQGLCVLKSRDIVVADKTNQVLMFDCDGKFIKKIVGEHGQEFLRPGDMTLLHNGDFAIKDMTGIQVFNGKGVFISRAWRNTKRWKSYGMAEDEDQCLWFIDCGPQDTVIKKIDLLNGNRVLVKIFLADIIGEVYSESKCRFLTLAGGKLFITDLGLDQVFVMSTSGDIGSVRRFGCSGDGEGMFSDPAGVVVDDVGNILVADSKNHRLCLFDKKRNWIKKLQAVVRRPSAILLDSSRGELYCLNMQGREAVVKYALT